MKATVRNGRTGKHGVYKANHNTLAENRANAPHTRNEKTPSNVCYQFNADGRVQRRSSYNSRAHELKRYKEIYGDYLESQNERYKKKWNYDRIKTMEQIYDNPKFTPMESILQIGKKDDNIPPDQWAKITMKITEAFMASMLQKYNHPEKGAAIIPLSAALHMDEESVHVHFRYTFACKDRYGDLKPAQEKTLERLGFEYNKPDQKMSRYNNRLISFTDTIREDFYQLCERCGIKINREVENPSRRHLETLEGKVKVAEEKAQAAEQKAIEAQKQAAEAKAKEAQARKEVEAMKIEVEERKKEAAAIKEQAQADIESAKKMVAQAVQIYDDTTIPIIQNIEQHLAPENAKYPHIEIPEKKVLGKVTQPAGVFMDMDTYDTLVKNATFAQVAKYGWNEAKRDIAELSPQSLTKQIKALKSVLDSKLEKIRELEGQLSQETREKIEIQNKLNIATEVLRQCGMLDGDPEHTQTQEQQFDL